MSLKKFLRRLFGVKEAKPEVKCEPPKYDPDPKVARVTIQPGKKKPDIPKVNPKVVGVKVTTETRPDPLLDPLHPLNPLNPLSPISPLNPFNQANDEPVRHRDHHERVDSTTISDTVHHSTPVHHSSHDSGYSHHSHDSSPSYDSPSYDSSPSHHNSSW